MRLQGMEEFRHLDRTLNSAAFVQRAEADAAQQRAAGAQSCSAAGTRSGSVAMPDITEQASQEVEGVGQTPSKGAGGGGSEVPASPLAGTSAGGPALTGQNVRPQSVAAPHPSQSPGSPTTNFAVWLHSWSGTGFVLSLRLLTRKPNFSSSIMISGAYC